MSMWYFYLRNQFAQGHISQICARTWFPPALPGVTQARHCFHGCQELSTSPERGLGCGGCARVHEARGCTCEVAGTLYKAGRHVQDHQEPPGPLRRGQRKQQKPRLTAQNSCPRRQGLCLLAFCYSSLVQLFVSYHINEKLMNTWLRTALGIPMGAQDSRSFWKVRSLHRSDSRGRNRPSAWGWCPVSACDSGVAPWGSTQWHYRRDRRG